MSITKNIRDAMNFGLEKVVEAYNFAYEKATGPTKFLSTLAGTLGGDYIAKKFTQGESLTWRDVAFTSFAAAYQSWLYPKFIDLTNYLVEKPIVKKACEKMHITKEWAKTIVIGAAFFLPNMAYWGLLSMKNRTPITMKGAGKAAESIAIGSIPYLGVDYLVTNKLDKKYCQPVWAAAEVVYNTFLAAVAYLAR